MQQLLLEVWKLSKINLLEKIIEETFAKVFPLLFICKWILKKLINGRLFRKM
jgi:hypothetical protein